LIFSQGIVYERTIFISFSSWIDIVPSKPGENFRISSLVVEVECRCCLDAVAETGIQCAARY